MKSLSGKECVSQHSYLDLEAHILITDKALSVEFDLIIFGEAKLHKSKGVSRETT
jgi:hypothetical protein